MLTTLLLATLTIRADQIVDGRGNVIHNGAVVVDGDKIAAIDPHPKHADIDLGKRTLMPGGIDTHVPIGWHFGADGRSHPDNSDHSETPEAAAFYAAENAVRVLESGITTVQSLGAPIDKPLRDAIARGVLPGPRILTAIDPIGDEKLT